MTDSNNLIDDEYLQDMLPEFLDEADEILEQLSDHLLTLDEAVKSASSDGPVSTDAELLNEMFRGAHTLKGLSGMLGFGGINSLTHKMENVFDASRNGRLQITTNVVEVVFHALDGLTAMINGLKDGSKNSVEHESVVEEIRALLEPQAEAGAETATDQEVSENKASPAIEDDNVAEATSTDVNAANGEAADMAAAGADPFAEIQDDVDNDSPYLSIFIDETDTTIRELETLLNRPDEKTPSEALVLCHRIKGSAASIGLNQAARLAHVIEDLLEQMLETNSQFSVPAIDSLFEFTKVLSDYLDGLKQGQFRSQEFGRIYASVHQTMGIQAAATDALPTPTDTNDVPVIRETNTSDGDAAIESAEQRLQTREQECRDAVTAAVPAGVIAAFVRVDFRSDLTLPDLTARLVFEKLNLLGEVFFCNPAETEIDSLEKLDSLFVGVATDHTVSEIESRVKVSGVEGASIRLVGEQDTPANETTEIAPDPIVPSKSAAASEQVAAPPVSPTQEARPPQAAATAKAEKKPVANGQETKPAETVRVDIDRLDQLMNLAGQLVINKARFSQIGTGMKQLISGRRSSSSLFDAAAISKLNDDLDVSSNMSDPTAKFDDIRAHLRQVQSQFDDMQRQVNQLDKMRPAIAELLEAVHQLDRVADGIQKSVMDTRMVPIGPLFSRFKRVVRDISRSEHKEISLVIRGETTELDKRMIDELGDPLIHIVRNSADHGIEPPDVREAAGKPRQGTVTLDASHRGNSIVIQIIDDGKGLDVQRIRAKAIEKGIVTEADAEKMSDLQAFQLIWEPGFSTAEKITNVSGRGMGMDIVRSKIEDISGTVELDSAPGVGTTITIKLPLTLAILPSLLADINHDVFAVPVETVSEIVCVPKADLSHVHGLLTASVRGRVVSVVELSQLFEWNQPAKQGTLPDTDETTLVIVENDGQEVGLVVHGLLGEQDIVIKSLAENYRNVDGIAGASILGDGRVSLILDVGALILNASKIKQSTH